MKKLYMCTALLVMLAGCQESEMPEDKEVNSAVPESMDASIVIKGKVEPGKEVILETTVKQGSQLVNEADEVLFEVRKSGQDKREMLEAKNTGSGMYQVMYTFEEQGKYIVVSHVTAKGLHVMPEKEVVVPGHESEGASVHPSTDVSIGFQSNPVKAGNSSNFEATVELNGKPLTNADVNFEVWKEGSEESHFTKAEEDGNGTYLNKVSFEEAGTYKVQVHVEKDEVHEHQLQTIYVN
ncbi:FixH family protein [Peribacillus frigoritolerans]|uniref:FixH family protein n=1 Tax=Peribacillus frigoritolerans TaxID=450367 RepID=UPI00207ACC3C|nr:FixH family protein [Peribacillus frigoritolerans]USK66160.1 FixH family protein [Peribacillus frigoritolerans]